MPPTSFLFVCTGNICRSPLAEAAMRAEAKRRGLELDIDSAGTGAWHIGDRPDARACKVAQRQGLDIETFRARQIDDADFERFEHIIALDHGHLRALGRLAPDHLRHRVTLLLDHTPNRKGEEVDDPYYGPDSGFEITWETVREGCAHLAARTLDG